MREDARADPKCARFGAEFSRPRSNFRSIGLAVVTTDLSCSLPVASIPRVRLIVS